MTLPIVLLNRSSTLDDFADCSIESFHFSVRTREVWCDWFQFYSKFGEEGVEVLGYELTSIVSDNGLRITISCKDFSEAFNGLGFNGL